MSDEKESTPAPEENEAASEPQEEASTPEPEAQAEEPKEEEKAPEPEVKEEEPVAEEPAAEEKVEEKAEEAPEASAEDAKEEEKPTYEYGVMKATSELAAINTFGAERSIIVRPQLIVGPGDPTDRFPYWLARIEKGGDFIIPGKRDEVVQYIDVRDLAQWMIRLAENESTGTYNGAGPGFELTTNAFVHGIHANYNVPINYIQIDDFDFLLENGIIGLQPWVIQLPEYAGMSKTDTRKAIESGLSYRSLTDTVQATKEWWYSDAVSQKRRDNILNGERSFMKREKDLLEKWRNKQ